MVFSENKEGKKTSATLTNGNLAEKYDCSFWACDNPVCSCGTLTIEFSPAQNKSFSDRQLSSHTIEMDIIKRKMAFKDKEKVSKENLAFSERVLSQLGDDDFQLLNQRHFAYKNKITENAGLEKIDAHFDYDEVEQNGLMSAYNDVLPYGDQMRIAINKQECLVLDQYCLLPKCPCSDVTLSLMAIDITGKGGDELCAVEVNYRKKQWKTVENFSLKVSTKAVKSTIEEQVPDFYKRLLKRHVKLKSIYAHCKKKHFAPTTPIELPKIGRNEPCPCGSGKKYKKCCLNKSN
ncbi:MAG: SEC-C metal-binding domain-containing protein [Desulfobacteraceae bacterium]|jgi:hypothetical protein|nr:SEC-C metal-binding domain-containing protein [Desulfobacteraceae bacterium]